MEEKILTPLKAIRAKCLDCCCWQPTEVRLCPVKDCPLYPYRMGHNPRLKGRGNPEALEKVRLAKVSNSSAKTV